LKEADANAGVHEIFALSRKSWTVRRNVWIDLLLYPTHTLPTAAAPVIVGVGLAVHNGVFSAVPAAIAFGASWLIHVGGVFTDNYQLLTRHKDIPEHPELTDAVNDGSLRLSRLWWAIAACFILAALTAPYLTSVAGVAVLLFGALGILASLGYSVSRFSLCRLGIADPVFFVMFGIVAVAGIYYVQAVPAYAATSDWRIVPQALPLSAFVLGLPVGAIVTNILLIDDIRDREFDARKGWRTEPVRFGVGWTRLEFVALMLFAYLIPVWFWLGLHYSPWILLPLLTLPVAAGITRVICTQLQIDRLFPMTPKAAGLALQYAVLLGVGIAVRG
jgi:1,4-dihydroxy-2-naphthoate octaprenyltransferase